MPVSVSVSNYNEPTEGRHDRRRTREVILIMRPPVGMRGSSAWTRKKGILVLTAKVSSNCWGVSSAKGPYVGIPALFMTMWMSASAPKEASAASFTVLIESSLDLCCSRAPYKRQRSETHMSA